MHTSRLTPQAAAAAYAALLDRLAAADHLGRSEVVLAEVGDLLGGLSCNGFALDLAARMDGIEAEHRFYARYGSEWPNLGSRHPDPGISAELEGRIDAAQDAAARAWLRDAAHIMSAKHEVSAPEAPALRAAA